MGFKKKKHISLISSRLMICFFTENKFVQLITKNPSNKSVFFFHHAIK